MKYLIKNAQLLLYDKSGYQLKKEDLLIDGSVIKKIGGIGPEDIVSSEIINAENMLVMPGLVNMHTHAYMSFMKNSADDLPFHNWLFDRIIPIEEKLEKEGFYWGTMLGCIEMIRTGTTAYLDMHICEKECAKAARDSGLRAFIGKCIRGEDLYVTGGDFVKVMEEKEEYENGLIKFVLSPHSIYSCSERMLFQIIDEAQKLSMLKHIHLSESEKEVTDCIKKHRKTPVEFLNSLGFLDDNTIASHCVKVSDNDVEILKSNNVNVVTNPSSNAKLGNGIAPITKMLYSGINVCLGTDSAASNNTLNLFREMNIFSLIHKADNASAMALPAREILKSVSINPAKALHISDRSGSISEGYKADLIFINLNETSLFPNNNIVSSLCYSANGSEVDSVMVNGKFLMRNKQLIEIDEERVHFEVSRLTEKYL